MKHSIDRRDFITTFLLATGGITSGFKGVREFSFAHYPFISGQTGSRANDHLKILFFDNREVEILRNFTRELRRPEKDKRNPLFIADAPWENNNMQLYGSVIKVPGKPFQMWYSVIHKPWNMYLAYAESKDGIVWERPLFDIYKFGGNKTNIIFTENPHGPAILYDADDPREDWRYKMVAGAGSTTTDHICGYHSADGIHWLPAKDTPILATKPDCPMGFLRMPNGKYVIYHRFTGFGRRVFRSESADFCNWPGEPRMVFEPDSNDPPQIQFYGMGSIPYGPYEIGTLWIYNTDPEDRGRKKMHGYQEAELSYARSGYAWHRAAQGNAFIPHGGKGEWDRGNLQCASSPVFLDNEIRYYYMGTNMLHSKHWELEPQTAGLGLATIKPDRFVALRAADKPAELMTYGLELPSNNVFVNAATEKNGWIRLEILDEDGTPVKGFSEADCKPVSGDSIKHAVHWRGADAGIKITEKQIRIRLLAQNADVFSIYSCESDNPPPYYRFRDSQRW